MSRKKIKYPVLLALEKAGVDVSQFPEEKLGYSYQTFVLNLKKNNWPLSHIHIILHYTGKSFEDLFPNPHEFTRQHVPIQLNLKKTKPEPVKPPTPAPKENQEPVIQLASAPLPFVIEDIYENGIPATEETTLL